MSYDNYNREERALCAHLFRLLQNSIHSDPELNFFERFLANVAPDNGGLRRDIDKLSGDDLRKARVYVEVALMRDVVAQEKICESQLARYCDESCPPERRWSKPQQIISVKPDLAIVLPNLLLVVEVKFTSPFTPKQLKRTECLVEVWREAADGAAFKALGLAVTAPAYVVCIGSKEFADDFDYPYADWQALSTNASALFPGSDPSVLALQSAAAFLEAARATQENRGPSLPYQTSKGISGLLAFMAQKTGGYIGYTGGQSQLKNDITDPERRTILQDREFKWLDKNDYPRQNAGNWLPINEFIELLELGVETDPAESEA